MASRDGIPWNKGSPCKFNFNNRAIIQSSATQL